MVHLVDAVPFAGVLLANAKILSPLSAVLNVRETASLGALNPVPLVAVTGNNAGWAMYSWTTHDPWVLSAAAPGVLIGLFYVATMYESADEQTRALIAKMVVCYAAALGMADWLSAGTMMGWSASAIFGTLCSALLFCFYTSPLPAMHDAMRTRSAERIHQGLASTTLCNAGLWLTYGLSQHDWHIYVPQSVGVLIAASQLVLAQAFRHEEAR